MTACKAQNVFENSFVVAKMSVATTANLLTKVPGSRQDRPPNRKSVACAGRDVSTVRMSRAPLTFAAACPVNRPPGGRLVSERTPVDSGALTFSFAD